MPLKEGFVPFKGKEVWNLEGCEIVTVAVTVTAEAVHEHEVSGSGFCVSEGSSGVSGVSGSSGSGSGVSVSVGGSWVCDLAEEEEDWWSGQADDGLSVGDGVSVAGGEEVWSFHVLPPLVIEVPPIDEVSVTVEFECSQLLVGRGGNFPVDVATFIDVGEAVIMEKVVEVVKTRVCSSSRGISGCGCLFS